MQIAYENAYSCQYYGYGKKHWLYENDDLSKEDLDRIWNKATDDLANDKPCGFVYASKDDFSEIEKVLIEEKCQ